MAAFVPVMRARREGTCIYVITFLPFYNVIDLMLTNVDCANQGDITDICCVCALEFSQKISMTRDR